MPLFRLYTGNDGQSHIEPIALAKTPDWGKGLSPRRSPSGKARWATFKIGTRRRAGSS